MIAPITYTLANGLKVILIESHLSPVVSINICIKVGSVYETEEEAGLCHLIEHMLFKGTPTLGPGDLAKTIESCGGDVNAYTSFDETVYYCTLASRYYQKGLEILSDGVLHSVFDPTELDREKIVVVEELQRGKDSPSRLLSEELFNQTYQVHPYRRPIIGYRKTIEQFNQAKVLDFYHRWYVPNNMVVVVAGDFSLEAVKNQINDIFGSLQSQSVHCEVPIEPTQTNPRSFRVTSKVNSTLLTLAFPAKNLAHPHTPVLDILSHVLGEGEGSRLDHKIRDQLGLVNSIYSYVYSPKHDGMFVIGAALEQSKVPKACPNILSEIYQFTERKITHDELARAKINIKSDAIYELETVEGLARKYGYFENILADMNFGEKYLQAIDSVTVDQVIEVAREYLRPERLTLGLLQPEETKHPYLPPKLLQFGQVNSKKTKPRKAAQDILRCKLKNGIRLVLKENHSVPILTLRSAHLGGLRSEDKRCNGISTLTSQLWAKSTQNYSSEELAREIELCAGSFEAYAGKNSCGLKGDFISEKFHEGFKLFFEIFKNPLFDAVETKRERANMVEAIKRSEDDLADKAVRQFLSTLYPKHPYGLPSMGTIQSAKGLNEQKIKSYYRKIINPKNTAIVVVGDFDIPSTLELLESELESLKPIQWKTTQLPLEAAPRERQLIKTHKGKNQAHIVYGFRGLTIKSKDRFAMEVLNNILAGQGGRLFLELRDKHSLAYSVTSFNQEGIEPGFFAVYLATDPKKTEFAVEKIEEELRKITQEVVSPEELHRSQQFIIGNYDIDLQKISSIANEHLFNELYQLGEKDLKEYPRKISQVTSADVLKVAQKYIQLDHPVISIVD
ncbi:MAG: insulinase family protein [Deltaproteobacteria bacterium]|nr:insulinase family protein [Deltaproteobacteria bacterium]